MGRLIDGLKPARERAGITQASMAQLLGWSESSGGAHVGRVEKGQRNTDPDTVERWYELCGAEVIVVFEADAAEAARAMITQAPRPDLVVRLIKILPTLDDTALDRLEADLRWLETRYGHKMS